MMQQPVLKRTVIQGQEYVLCDQSHRSVVEYVYWAAGTPVKTKIALVAARKYLPDLSYPNFSDRVADLVREGKLNKLKHGVYIHKEVRVIFG